MSPFQSNLINLVCLGILICCIPASARSDDQQLSFGDCSPNIADVSGDVSVSIVCKIDETEIYLPVYFDRIEATFPSNHEFGELLWENQGRLLYLQSPIHFDTLSGLHRATVRLCGGIPESLGDRYPIVIRIARLRYGISSDTAFDAYDLADRFFRVPWFALEDPDAAANKLREFYRCDEVVAFDFLENTRVERIDEGSDLLRTNITGLFSIQVRRSGGLTRYLLEEIAMPISTRIQLQAQADRLEDIFGRRFVGQIRPSP